MHGGGWEIRTEGPNLAFSANPLGFGGGWEIRTPAPDHSRLTI